MSSLHPSSNTGSNDTGNDTGNDAGTRLRPGTIIWGVVTIVIGALILIGELADISLDPVVVVMTLLIGTGLALVIGGILSMTRRNGRSSE